VSSVVYNDFQGYCVHAQLFMKIVGGNAVMFHSLQLLLVDLFACLEECIDCRWNCAFT
jgi:hypothetical protein